MHEQKIQLTKDEQHALSADELEQATGGYAGLVAIPSVRFRPRDYFPHGIIEPRQLNELADVAQGFGG